MRPRLLGGVGHGQCPEVVRVFDVIDGLIIQLREFPLVSNLLHEPETALSSQLKYINSCGNAPC